MEPKEAEALLMDALCTKPDRLLVTTPQIAFNGNYPIDDELRHEDHVTEHDTESFRLIIDNAVRVASSTTGKAFDVEFEGIGDTVNGIQPTQAAIITKVDS
jgi:hypothetical protein